MAKKKFIFFIFLLLVNITFAYDPSLITDKYTYSVNESIFAVGSVKINVTAISNVSVVFTVKDVSDTTVSTSTFVTNSSGQFNSTFSLTSAGNYTLVANVSGDVVKHFIKIKSYAKISLSLSRPSYTTSSAGTATISVADINGAGVSGQGVTSSIRYANGTVLSSLSACTTDSLGQCTTNFTAPSDDGSYVLEVNNFENSVSLVIGGYDAFMKISPSIVGKNQNVTVKVIVKNSNGNGITASTRQVLVTAPNGTQTTLTAMTPANDSSGSALTGVYEDKLSFDAEGIYEVKVTVQPQGSNLTRELNGGFTVSSYLLEFIPWAGTTTLFTPGETVSLGVRLRNGSSNEFMKTTQCGSGSCTTSLGAATVLDPSGVATGYEISVSEKTSLNLYRMDITLPSNAKSGTYKVKVSLNDSFGTGSGDGYFNVQFAKAKMRALDKFPGGISKETFLPGKQIVLEFAVTNASGAVNITGISSYSIRDTSGNDKTSIFGTGVTYFGNNNKSYINITAPNKGERYIAKAKLNTLLGTVDAEGSVFVDVLEIEIRPKAIGGGTGGGFTPFGGPGFMFAFRPNDTINLQVTLKTASEKSGSEGFMSGGLGKGGSAAGGHSVGVGGMFGIGGGTVVQGGQIIVDKIINLNTEEDATSSTTITNCITDSTGICTLTLKSNTNGQNWTGGFYIMFVNVTTSDNQTDDGQGFFEVRRYMVNVQTRAATAKNATSSGFMSFNDWFVGPDDNINVSIRIIEPGTWQAVSLNGNATIQGIYYAGSIGEFIFPPKLQSGTNATANIINSVASAVISAPSGGWKSGSYIVKVTANVSGVLDTGDSFLMVKIYQGFGQPINPITNQMDFTVSSTENATIRINVFDVRNNRPAANLTVTLGKILSFESFPPSEITYDKSNVTTGTTDSNGQVVMVLPVPSGGWPTGNFLTNFDVTNGTVSDSIQGFFQVKNFFAELSPAKWRFATNETVSFNATISSDPSWMRQQFGGGCPAGDPMCAGGGMSGGGAPQPAPVPITVNHTFVPFNSSLDLDGDGQKDINITGLASPGFMFNLTGNLTAAKNNSDGSGFVGTAIAANFWCFNTISCQQLPAPVGGNLTNGFDGVDCDAAAGTYSNTTTHNMSGPSVFCVNTTNGSKYKVQSEFANASGINIGFVKHTSGAVGGIAPPNLTGTQGFSYYNATLKSVKVVKFDFSTGETLLRQNIDYNLTSATGSTIGDGKIVIPGVGSFKLVPNTTWASGFYRVIAEFNISATSSETAESGFSVETFFASCYRSSWGAVASGANISIRCDVTDPGSGGAYANLVDMEVESIKNIFTFQDVSTGWSSNRNFTDATKTSAFIQLSQSLGNGQYEARIKLNASSSDVKRQSVWFEIKDFDPVFYSEKWSYASADNVTLRVQGLSGNLYLPVNLSFTGGSPEIVVYRYDKSTGSKSTVSGITISITNSSDQFWPFNATLINLTKSGGWDEGSYEVMANVTRMNAARTSATGGKVEVRTWFEVRLFNVWGWSESWSNHPKSNVTLRVHVGVAGNWWQFYNGNVNATITAVTNTQTGAVLTRGTDYNATNATANPSSVGDLNMSIIPVTSLPTGQYRATVKVTDCNPACSSGKSMTTDVWFDVKAFQFWVYTERYEYASTDDVVFIFNVYSPGGGNTTLTGGRITYLSKCTATTCSTVDVGLNSAVSNATVFNAITNRLTILNTSGLTTGWYWAEIKVNDTQNATVTSGAGFQIKSFGASGYVQRPSPSRYYYYINETMLLNVTATPGTNITHATFRYWDCSTGTCLQIPFIVNISQNVTAQNILVNMTPTGLNNTWPTGRWGYREYTIDVSARKDGDTSTFTASGVYVQFIGPWNVTGPGSVAPSDNITINMTVYVADITNATQGQLRLANAVINVSNVWSATTAGYNNMSTTPGVWNHTGNITDANGLGQAIIKPDINRFNWTSGNIVVFMTIKYGNATTYVYYHTTVAQKTLNILGKNIKNTTMPPDAIPNNRTLVTAPSCTTETNGLNECWYNMTIRVNNPQSVDATAGIIVTTSRLNLSATINNQSVTNLTAQSIPAGASPTFNFTYNVTGITNITHVIQFTPTTSGFATMSTTYTYASAAS